DEPGPDESGPDEPGLDNGGPGALPGRSASGADNSSAESAVSRLIHSSARSVRPRRADGPEAGGLGLVRPPPFLPLRFGPGQWAGGSEGGLSLAAGRRARRFTGAVVAVPARSLIRGRLRRLFRRRCLRLLLLPGRAGGRERVPAPRLRHAQRQPVPVLRWLA